MTSQTLNIRQKTKKSNKPSLSAFITKTYEILEDAQYTDIIDWNADGTQIIIKKSEEFAEKVLNTYFKHKNLNSFVRQLNMYSFHKKRTNTPELHYYHELFQKGKKHLLEQIKRKNQEPTYVESSEDASSVGDSTGQEYDTSKLLQEKNALKRLNAQNAEKVICLEGRVKDLVVENESLKARLMKQEEKDAVVFSLMANILKKYGIAPTELTTIMNESQNDSSCQKTQTQTQTPTPEVHNNYYQEQAPCMHHPAFVPTIEAGSYLNNEMTSSYQYTMNKMWTEQAFLQDESQILHDLGVAHPHTHPDPHFSYIPESSLRKRHYNDHSYCEESCHEGFYGYKLPKF